jgi:hypothetical protein
MANKKISTYPGASMLTQERLKEVLCYNPMTGVFTRAKAVKQTKIGDIAGSRNTKGYLHIMIDNKFYTAHRMAFLYMLGYFPESDVDHKNGVRDDNRWCNLRSVSRSCNMQNCKIRSSNWSGFNGVTWSARDKKWRSQITISDRHIYLGSHDDKISAALHRCYYEACCPEWTCNHQGVNFEKLRNLGYVV